MKRKLIIIIIIALSGCHGIPKDFVKVQGNFNAEIQESCTSLMSDIESNWARHNKYHCYYNNSKLINKILEKNDCLKGISSKEIIKLFGEPNVSEDYILIYSVAKKCNKSNDIYGDFSLKFRFNYSDINNELVVSKIKFDKVIHSH